MLYENMYIVYNFISMSMLLSPTGKSETLAAFTLASCCSCGDGAVTAWMPTKVLVYSVNMPDGGR